jgi:hypothetical protein
VVVKVIFYILLKAPGFPFWEEKIPSTFFRIRIRIRETQRVRAEFDFGPDQNQRTPAELILLIQTRNEGVPPVQV